MPRGTVFSAYLRAQVVSASDAGLAKRRPYITFSRPSAERYCVAAAALHCGRVLVFYGGGAFAQQLLIRTVQRGRSSRRGNGEWNTSSIRALNCHFREEGTGFGRVFSRVWRMRPLSAAPREGRRRDLPFCCRSLREI